MVSCRHRNSVQMAGWVRGKRSCSNKRAETRLFIESTEPNYPHCPCRHSIDIPRNNPMNADSQSTGLNPERERENDRERFRGVIISISLFLLLVIEFCGHTVRNLSPYTHPLILNPIWFGWANLNWRMKRASIMESIWNRDTGGGSRQYLNRPIISFSDDTQQKPSAHYLLVCCGGGGGAGELFRPPASSPDNHFRPITARSFNYSWLDVEVCPPGTA